MVQDFSIGDKYQYIHHDMSSIYLYSALILSCISIVICRSLLHQSVYNTKTLRTRNIEKKNLLVMIDTLKTFSHTHTHTHIHTHTYTHKHTPHYIPQKHPHPLSNILLSSHTQRERERERERERNGERERENPFTTNEGNEIKKIKSFDGFHYLRTDTLITLTKLTFCIAHP